MQIRVCYKITLFHSFRKEQQDGAEVTEYPASV
jgi:hypothetical protein